MANPYRAEIPVTLGVGDEAKEYVLVFDQNAMVELEENTGISPQEVLEKISGDEPSPRLHSEKFIRGALAAALSRKYPHMTPQRVGAVMDPKRYDEYGYAIMRGMIVARTGRDINKPAEEEPPGESKAPAQS